MQAAVKLVVQGDLINFQYTSQLYHISMEQVGRTVSGITGSAIQCFQLSGLQLNWRGRTDRCTCLFVMSSLMWFCLLHVMVIVLLELFCERIVLVLLSYFI